jgi:hypothetical protein
MSLIADQRRRSKVRARAGTFTAPSFIEMLESRQLLAAHCLAVATGEAAGSALPALQATVAATTFPSGSLEIKHIAPGDGAATAVAETSSIGNCTASGTAATPALQAADASTPVQRLGSGSQFSGYDYIPPDGSAPPPVVVVVEMNGGQLTEVGSGGVHLVTTAPKKIKPSDVGLPVPADAGPALTPLAQTPAARTPIKMSGDVAGLQVPAVLPIAAASAGSQASGRTATPHTTLYLGPVAMADPAEVVLAANPAAVGIADGLAYASNKAADALALIASPNDLAAGATYNFVHFNPAILLNDAIAAFSRDSATLSLATAPVHSTAHAWSITAAVIGVDLFLIGYCYQKSRRRKSIAAKFADNHIPSR